MGEEQTSSLCSFFLLRILEGLKEVPELGIDPEKVENTTLADTIKQYEFGIGDAGELEYKFTYENLKVEASY